MHEVRFDGAFEKATQDAEVRSADHEEASAFGRFEDRLNGAADHDFDRGLATDKVCDGFKLLGLFLQLLGDLLGRLDIGVVHQDHLPKAVHVDKHEFRALAGEMPRGLRHLLSALGMLGPEADNDPHTAVLDPIVAVDHAKPLS